MNEIELTKILVGNPVTAPHFCGVISHDQLNKLPTRLQQGFYVCNTDDSTGPGEHWVTVSWFQGQESEFFDSLAKSPTEYSINFTNFLINNGPQYKMSTMRIQGPHSIKCGEFCLFYAYHRCKGYTLNDIVTMFSKTHFALNDFKVERFVNKM